MFALFLNLTYYKGGFVTIFSWSGSGLKLPGRANALDSAYIDVFMLIKMYHEIPGGKMFTLFLR